MVFLKDLKSQWPWNAQAKEEFEDKEVYTHHVDKEDASTDWRIPILPPLDGFAYVGMRVLVYGKNTDYTVVPRLVLGERQEGMFGMPWDNTLLSNGVWAPLGFPLTHKMIAITEDGLDSLIHHSEPCWGKVEFLAQRFDDLLEDETDISYIFLNHRTDKAEWILNPKNTMYKPNGMEVFRYNQKSKIIPSILRLLEPERDDWNDTEVWWKEVALPWPFVVQANA